MTTTIFEEEFDTDGNGTRYITSIPEFTDGAGDFFTRTDGSNIGSFYEVAYVPARVGEFFFAAQDIDGEGSASQQTLTFAGIDISGFTDLAFSMLAAEDDDGSNQDWDLSDFVHIDYQIDGGGFQNLIHFESIPDGDATNAVPALDTDFDGDGDGTELTSTFADFSAAIAGTGSLLDLRITFDLNSGDEDIAIDDLRLTGTVDPGTARTVLAESFETDGNGTRYVTSTPEFSDGSGDFLTRTDGSNISSAYQVFGPDGEFYFAAQDIDGEGAGAEQTLTFSGLDISRLEGLRLSFLAAEDDDGTNEDWDLSDFVNIDYQIDGGGFQNLIHFESIPDGDSFNAVPALDTDFDGDGDGTELTSTFSEFTAAITGTGSVLDLRITFNLDSGDEDFAVDDIVIDGTVADTSLPALEIASANAERAEGDSGNTAFTFTVTRSGDTSGESSADWAVTGGDVDAEDFGGLLPSGTVTFAAGETSAEVTVNVSGDTDFEQDESFTVTLSNPTGATISGSVATGTIQNDDAPSLTKVYDIQGSGAASALEGQVVTVEAVVTGDFQNGDADEGRDLRGFYVQEETGDGDAATSDGIFVFDALSALDVGVGDKVRITGEVTEFFGETQIALDSIAIIGEGSVAATLVELPALSTVENADGELIADLEQYEGMLVSFADDLTVDEYFNYDRFGEIVVSEGDRPFQFTQVNDPDVAGFQAWQEELASRRITIDDGKTTQNPDFYPYPGGTDADGNPESFSDSNFFRGGDLVTELEGVVRFSRGSGGSGDETYRIMPTEEVTFEARNPRPESPEDVSGPGRTDDDILKLSSFNVLNYFTTLDLSGAQTVNGSDPRGADNLAEFERQREKLIATLVEIDADIFGLVELENDFLEGSPGNAVEDLVGGLNEALGGTIYDWVRPQGQFVDASDAISVGMIYKVGSVQLAEGTTVETLRDEGIVGDLAGEQVFDGGSTNRAPLAATFEEISSGAEMTVAVNHFKSKGSVFDVENEDQEDGAGNNNAIRLDASIALDAWLKTNPTGSDTDDILLLGDFNAYAREDPVTYLTDEAGYTDVAALFSEDTPYSFLFDGQLGTLDYGFASASLVSKVTGATEWHVNADEADLLDYNLDFGRLEDVFNGANAFRNSDHDPLIVGIDLGAPEPETVVARIDFEERRGRDAAVYSLDGEDVSTDRLRLLQREIDLEEAGVSISADDGLWRSPEFVTTAGNGIGVRSIFGDRFFGVDRKVLDGRETLSVSLDPVDGVAEAVSVALELEMLRGSGEVDLAFYDDDALIDAQRIGVENDRVAYALADSASFDRVEIGTSGSLQFAIGAVEFERIIDDGMGFA